MLNISPINKTQFFFFLMVPRCLVHHLLTILKFSINQNAFNIEEKKKKSYKVELNEPLASAFRNFVLWFSNMHFLSSRTHTVRQRIFSRLFLGQFHTLNSRLMHEHIHSFIMNVINKFNVLEWLYNLNSFQELICNKLS